MKTWNQLFVRHGWLLEGKSANRFDCSKETEENIAFLVESLEKVNVLYSLEEKELVIYHEPIDEESWINVLDFNGRGRTESICLPNELPIRTLDTYMAGVVRQLNRLGFRTTMSCDGHGHRRPYIYFDKSINKDWLADLLHVMGIPRVNIQENRQNFNLFLHVKRSNLLELAENLSVIQKEWLGKGAQFIEEQLFQQELENLLSIPGASRDEANIREIVKEKLTPYVDFITEDYYGNLLAEKSYGNGNGPTILLNAHLDTIEDFVEGREIIKEGNIWSSSEGILGADDRAGVAIILAIAKFLNQSDFRGKVKFVFTVEEEIGLVGARHVENYFLWDVDAAIVLDRRGNGDIVTSCWGHIPFCSKEFGEFFERVAKDAGLSGWQCTAGGSSDTRIWASRGIQSVNLSVGYKNEHSYSEYLDVQATYETYTLLKAVFQKSSELRRLLRNISRENYQGLYLTRKISM